MEHLWEKWGFILIEHLVKHWCLQHNLNFIETKIELLSLWLNMTFHCSSLHTIYNKENINKNLTSNEGIFLFDARIGYEYVNGIVSSLSIDQFRAFDIIIKCNVAPLALCGWTK